MHSPDFFAVALTADQPERPASDAGNPIAMGSDRSVADTQI